MPNARTMATELGTALGMLGYQRLEAAVVDRSPALDIDADTWGRLPDLVSDSSHRELAAAAFENGRAFLRHDDGLGGRRPRVIEWTGGRRAPGDEVVPADLMVDHVLLVSCKYRSRVLHNAAPGRLFDDLLMSVDRRRGGDWFTEVAPREHQRLLDATLAALGLPARSIAELDPTVRRGIKSLLRGSPDVSADAAVTAAYAELVEAASASSATRWSERLGTHERRERMLWRLLRIYGAPYFVLGIDRTGPMRARIGTPWDWRQRYEFRGLDVSAGSAGQPTVDWVGRYRDREADAEAEVRGHIEVRWSHGRFSQPPEAKVYLDTPSAEVPGYQPLD